MKCPICNSEIRDNNDNKPRCIRCGFDDIRTEFINDEERMFWEAYVVYPCKYAYRLNKTLQMEVSSLRKEIKKLTAGGVNTDTTYTDTSDGGKAPRQPNTKLVEGWNYDDALTHPNGARCYHTIFRTNVKITDIKSQIDSLRNATVSFVAQRLADSPEKKKYQIKENQVGFCWRVKDEKGIIVLTGGWYNNNLLVGDAIADKIELQNVPDGYSIDFVDYTL